MCDTAFATLKQLQQHEVTHRESHNFQAETNDPEIKILLYCDECEYAGGSQRSLSVHKVKRHRDRQPGQADAKGTHNKSHEQKVVNCDAGISEKKSPKKKVLSGDAGMGEKRSHKKKIIKRDAWITVADSGPELAVSRITFIVFNQ